LLPPTSPLIPQNWSVDKPWAIAYLIDPTLFEGQDWSVVVPVDGPAKGTTIADRRGHFLTTPKVRCLMKVDEARFLEMFKARLIA
jgi:inosine-uridine nucleoside N-ribohydrolase